MDVKGTRRTKEFYNSQGWKTVDSGTTLDVDLFGVKEDGPLRRAMFERMWSRIEAYLGPQAGSEVLEVGCGGSPELRLLETFDNYVGADFSSEGLGVRG